ANAPWHLTFHPGGKTVYVVNELSATLSVYAFDKGTGGVRELQKVSTVPADFTGKSNPAEPRVDRAGKFLYVSNRDVSGKGQDSIAVYSIDASGGKVTPLEFVPSGGKTPRNIALDPGGSFLLAGNQGSNNLTVFRIDSKTGRLTPTTQVMDVPEPTCIAFARPERSELLTSSQLIRDFAPEEMCRTVATVERRRLCRSETLGINGSAAVRFSQLRILREKAKSHKKMRF